MSPRGCVLASLTWLVALVNTELEYVLHCATGIQPQVLEVFVQEGAELDL